MGCDHSKPKSLETNPQPYYSKLKSFGKKASRMAKTDQNISVQANISDDRCKHHCFGGTQADSSYDEKPHIMLDKGKGIMIEDEENSAPSSSYHPHPENFQHTWNRPKPPRPPPPSCHPQAQEFLHSSERSRPSYNWPQPEVFPCTLEISWSSCSEGLDFNLASKRSGYSCSHQQSSDFVHTSGIKEDDQQEQIDHLYPLDDDQHSNIYGSKYKWGCEEEPWTDNYNNSHQCYMPAASYPIDCHWNYPLYGGDRREYVSWNDIFVHDTFDKLFGSRF